MIKKSLLSSLLLFSQISYGQYCTVNVGPSSTIDSNVESVTLTGDSGSINYIGCPGVVGVEDQTSLSTVLSVGSNYVVNVQFGTCGGNYNGAGEVWIDFNGNQIFEQTESIGTWSGIPPTTMSSFNFTVPSNAVNQSVRMRVTQQEGGNLPLDPCASFSWGSVVDFTINITGGVNCTGVVGNDQNDPKLVQTLPYTDTTNNSVCYFNNNLVYSSPDVFYLLTSNVLSNPNGNINVSLCGSNFDTFLSVIDTDGNVIAYNDDGGCNTQSELSFNMSGLDSVFVIVEGWGSATGDFIIYIEQNTVGTKSFSNTTEFKAYPNPFNTAFSIPNVNNVNVIMYDITGKIVMKINQYNGASILSSNLSKGVYLLEIINQNSQHSFQKIIKQ